MAVKTLSSRDPEQLGKFLEEADIMKKFLHPNIVSLLGELLPIFGVGFMFFLFLIFNPWRACTARVTVVGLSVCVCYR